MVSPTYPNYESNPFSLTPCQYSTLDTLESSSILLFEPCDMSRIGQLMMVQTCRVTQDDRWLLPIEFGASFC